MTVISFLLGFVIAFAIPIICGILVVKAQRDQENDRK